MTPTFAPGSFFADRYLIEKLLGSGAMGRVYQAIEMHSDRQVALKVLHGTSNEHLFAPGGEEIIDAIKEKGWLSE